MAFVFYKLLLVFSGPVLIYIYTCRRVNWSKLSAGCLRETFLATSLSNYSDNHVTHPGPDLNICGPGQNTSLSEIV